MTKNLIVVLATKAALLGAVTYAARRYAKKHYGTTDVAEILNMNTDQ